MLVYRAVYALAGADAYSIQGEDGHFAWCAAIFERPDVRRVLDRAVEPGRVVPANRGGAGSL